MMTLLQICMLWLSLTTKVLQSSAAEPIGEFSFNSVHFPNLRWITKVGSFFLFPATNTQVLQNTVASGQFPEFIYSDRVHKLHIPI